MIDNSPRSFSKLYGNRFSRFIPEAVAKRKTGRWKIGSRCFQEAAASHSLKTKMASREIFSPWSSSQARRIKHRRKHWNASGKIERAVSQKIYRCLSWPRCLSAQSSLGTTAEFHISPQPREQTAFCCLARPIPMCGRRATKTYKCFEPKSGRLNDLGIAPVKGAVVTAMSRDLE